MTRQEQQQYDAILIELGRLKERVACLERVFVRSLPGAEPSAAAKPKAGRKRGSNVIPFPVDRVRP